MVKCQREEINGIFKVPWKGSEKEDALFWK
jgi:hypothetical protein